MKIYEANQNRFLIGEECMDVVKVCKEEKCDGYLQIKSHQIKVFNADGSEASLCVNGLHCFTHYLYDENKKYLIYALLMNEELYKSEIIQTEPFISKVEMGLPKVFRYFVDVGNEHIVLLSEDMKDAASISKRYDCNVNYVNVINSKCIEVRTYERGVGFTKSCGSGNIASSYYCYVNGLCDEGIDVLNEGGVCSIEIKDKIKMTVPSKFVRNYEAE